MITQKVFVAAAREYATSKSSTVFTLPWLLQETVRQCALLGGNPERAKRPESRAALDRLLTANAIRCMPDEQRRVLEMALFDRVTPREIGEALGQSEVETRRLLRTALLELRSASASGG